MKIMNGNYLLPHRFRRFGWVLLIIMLGLSLFMVISGYEIEGIEAKIFAIYHDEFFGKDIWFGWVENEIADELISIGLIIGALIVAFTKEKVEDEFFASIRLKSLVWATYFNHGILLLAIIFVYGMGFFNVMIFNMFTLLLFFIVKYQWSIHQWKKSMTDEE